MRLALPPPPSAELCLQVPGHGDAQVKSQRICPGPSECDILLCQSRQSRGEGGGWGKGCGREWEGRPNRVGQDLGRG